MSAQQIKVLIVEDNPSDAELMIVRLKNEGYQMDWRRVDSESEYLALLQWHPDLILSDWRLPGFSGLRALQLMRAENLDIPFVIVSGSIGEEAAIDALRQGAYDYVLKDRPKRLGQAVRHALDDKKFRYEREHSQKLLVESEERFRSLFEHSPVAYQSLDKSGCLIDVNDRLCVLLGYSREELLGRSFGELWSQESAPNFPLIFNRFVEQGSTAGEIDLIRKDGEQVIVQLEGKIQRDTQGRFVRTHCILYDITDRKRTEEAVRISEANLKKAQMVANVGSWAWHIPSNKLEWSDQMYVIFGIDRASFTGNLADVVARAIHPDDRAAVERSNINVVENKRPLPLEYRIIWPDQSIHTVWAEAGELILDKNGNPLILTGIVQDITERKKAEAILRESELKYRNLHESMMDAYVSVDLTYHLTEYNNSFVKMMGYAPDELALLTSFDLTPQQWHEYEMGIFSVQVMGVGYSQVYEKEFKRRDGSLIPVELRTYLLKNELDEPNGYWSIIRDITGRKLAEESLKQSAEELSRRNKELTRLYRIATTLISSSPYDLAGLAQTIVNIVVTELGKPNCGLYLVDQDAHHINRIALTGFGSMRFNNDRRTVEGPGLVPLCIRLGQLVNVANIHSNPDYIEGWPDAESELVVPLKAFDRVIGVLDLQSPRQDDFSSDDERLLRVFADQAAILLENTRLRDETKIQVERLNSLRMIDAAINASLDQDITIDVILDQVINRLQVDAVDILLLDPIMKTLKFIDGRGFFSNSARNLTFMMGQGLAGQAALQRQTVHQTQLDQQDHLMMDLPFIKEEKFVDYFGIPLIAKGAVYGVLEVYHRSALITDEAWLNFLSALSGQAAIAIDNINMFRRLQKSNDELMLAYDDNIEGWSRSLDMRDKETEGHTKRVKETTLKLAKMVGISDEEMIYIRWGAMLHDIGKMGVPDSILLKPGPLTEDEWKLMRMHPVYARDLIASITYLKEAIDIPYCHHEKWDGSGYPRGLKGEEIPLAARLFSVVDVWDALRSDRYYRKAWSEEEAIQYIREQSGKQFDPWVVEMFIDHYLKGLDLSDLPKILVVEDDMEIVDALKRNMEEHFSLYAAKNAEEAQYLSKKVYPEVVLVDAQLPDLDGIELLDRMHQANPKILGILLSSFSDASVLTRALNLGFVRGFFVAPWDMQEMVKKIEETVRQYRALV